METKPTPLKGKLYIAHKGAEAFWIEEDIASAVEFYRRYKSNVTLLKEEQTKIYAELINDIPDVEEVEFIAYVDDYEDWILNKAFEDVMKK